MRHIIRRVKTIPAAAVALAALLPLLILFSACDDGGTARQEALLHNLPPEVIRYLTADDDSVFTRYGREVGIEMMMIVHSRIGTNLSGIPEEDFERDAPFLFSMLGKTARVMESEFDYGVQIFDLDLLESLPPEQQRELLILRGRIRQTMLDPDLTVDRKLGLQIEFIKTFETRGDVIYAAVARMNVSELYSVISDTDNHILYLRAALEAFKRYGVHRMTCQALGILGGYHRRRGDIDSMTICYEKARKLADRSRLPTQAGRISSFYGGYYRNQGRLSLAHDMYRNSMELCREYGGGHLEARFVVDAMSYYADLSCWDITERLIERSRVLEHLYADEQVMDIFVLRTDQVEARMLLARGDINGATDILTRIDEPTRKQIHMSDYALLLHYWAKGLLDNGLAFDARPIAAKGMIYCAETVIPDWEAKFALLLARTEFECGNIPAVEAALARFEELANDPAYRLCVEWIDYDVLRGRMMLGSGDRRLAEASLVKSVNRLSSYVSARDASVHNYLWIDKCENLRHLMHDVFSGDASLGYGTELFWRRFYRDLGSAGNRDCTARSEGDLPIIVSGRYKNDELIGELRKLAEDARERIDRKDAVHLLYLVRDGEVWRWSVSSGGMKRDVLAISAGELRRLVAEARTGMAVDPGGAGSVVPPGLAGTLAGLAEALLPESFLTDPGGLNDGPLLITSNGFLGQIPFETFNVSCDGSYIPLLMHRDIAYLRFTGPETEVEGNLPGVILASPEPPAVLRKRYPFQRRLGEVLVEGGIIAATDPEAVFLRENRATKENLLNVWDRASYVYVATHTLRDPEVPYMTLIPLAAPDRQTGHEELFLDIADIRSADLGKCELFVLSGCSTGAPYCENIKAGPSLGDACLDAGAHAVIQTFWDIRDDEARALMAVFVDAWLNREMPPVRAICSSRRQALKGNGTVKHPFGWASYSIKLGRI